MAHDTNRGQGLLIWAPIISVSLTLESCTSAEDAELQLVCSGTETVHIAAGEGKGSQESRKIIRSIRFHKGEREVKSKTDLVPYYVEVDVRNGKTSPIPPATKRKVWIVQIDNGQEYYEEHSIRSIVNAPYPYTDTNNTDVSVDRNQLSLESTLIHEDKGDEPRRKSFSNFSLTINRLSGSFKSGFVENSTYQNAGVATGFFTVSYGACKKSERSF